ncbi:MAG: HAMP domain-containing sensor histidine kinase, partial [Bacteroidota bacterium]|nr:HAMP domain-containing sensor histidine kinase [Bacteroidota bacterium]
KFWFKKNKKTYSNPPQKAKDLKEANNIIAKLHSTISEKENEMQMLHDKYEKTNEKFRTRTIDVFGKMVDEKKIKKTINQQNQELESHRKEIEIQSQKLENASQKFRERTIELFGKMIDLKKAKKVIFNQNNKLENQQQKLEELNASKDKFFSIIAHDLRNPIGGFLNLTDIFSANFDGLSKKENIEFIELLNQSSKQLYNLLENLLEWSRSQTGRITYNPEILNLNFIIEDTIELLMANIKNKELEVNIESNKNEKIFADENMLTTVFRNLLSNAIKFSQKNSIITVRIIHKENNIEVHVIDNGVGISKENQKKLFRIDKHHSTSGTSNEKGSGLGLILCKELIDKNNGKIWVESELNKGSSFIFSLATKEDIN